MISFILAVKDYDSRLDFFIESFKQFPENIPIPVKKKIIRRAAKKATKTIKELVEQRLV